MNIAFTKEHDRHPENPMHLAPFVCHALFLLNCHHSETEETAALSALRIACLTEGVIRPNELFKEVIAEHDLLFIELDDNTVCLCIDRNGNVEVCTE